MSSMLGCVAQNNMTIKEFQDALRLYPDESEVFLAPRITEFEYGMANSVRMEEIELMEEPDGPVLSRDKVIIIDEE